ncbi:hypothetical protein BDB00DRAFT_849254 [Zychaea mexicana]|uniref:uncharacterized protein n=1 Tax=Zychaea mexicana TaxID=64656 RepID=UPI0022FE6514|nr:uncharacterized protein BDB00DRAFT_849254 [Zychaea mexicana]KAI9488266.1 hypothetical protein BDB00DRAFT_849254 [Zychaea mexicana]
MVEERMGNVVKCRYLMGGSFGTLSLLHFHRWPASYVAATDDVVLSELSREDYQSVLINDAESKRLNRRRLVDKVPTFNKLDPIDQNLVVDALTPVEYHDGQIVYNQGDQIADNRIFIIEYGTALGITETEGYSRTIEMFLKEGTCQNISFTHSRYCYYLVFVLLVVLTLQR